MRPFVILLFICLAPLARTQPLLESYEDGVYRDYIKSVKLHIHGLALTQPIATLGVREALFLSFDELGGQGTRYYYTVIHCDRYWKPTQELLPFDYLGGNREGEIRDYEISSGTYQHYLHYYVAIPNDDVEWRISGNYLLVVYEEGQEDYPVLTRRFMVIDPRAKILPEVVRPAVVSKQYSHQEVDFKIDATAINSYNPRMEISCTLLQNGRWDNRIEDITPRLVNGMMLDYNYTDRLVFEGGKEFRNMDISSMIYRSENVEYIEEFKEGFSTVLFPDEPRDRRSYMWRRDLNGMFVPYNRDYSRKRIPPDSLASTLNLVYRYNYREQQLGTEYSVVHLLLLAEEPYEKPVYVVGGMTDWKLLPEYKLTFDPGVGGYVGEFYLKQGYYNYGYAVPNERNEPDFSVLEGNWYATENQYMLLVYFRPAGGQYDQLVGGTTFDTYY